MEIIYKLSASGGLTEDVLQGVPESEVNSLNAETGLTPLGIALWHGHAECAKLLLKYKADPNGGRRGRPPLWVATLKTPVSQAEGLIQLLLNHNADATLASQHSGAHKGSTPLWNAVQTRKSPEIISRLVDAGADPYEIVPKENKSAYHLAKTFNDPVLLGAMQPSAKRTPTKLAQTSLVVAMIGAIVWWANANIRVSSAAGAVAVVAAGVAATSATEAKDAILIRFNMRGWLDTKFKQFEPKSVNQDDAKAKAEFREHLRKVVSDNKLDRFFPRYSTFLDNVINGAVRLDRDPTNLLNAKDLAHLALYKPILYCDDSGSMKEKTGSTGFDATRMSDQADLVQRIASITTRIIPEEGGIDLRFINKEEGLSNPSPGQVKDMMSGMTPAGGTAIGTKLVSKVLTPFLHEPLRKRQLTRPLLISIITDGAPNAEGETENTLKEAIEACGQALHLEGFPRNSVRFQISQIGSEPKAKDFLRILDSSGLDDVLHVTSDQLDQKFRKFHRNGAELEQWLLELLMSPIAHADPE
ncbi:hypothetical protein ARSEF1564_000394 [Beauveria bassiana]